MFVTNQQEEVSLGEGLIKDSGVDTNTNNDDETSSLDSTEEGFSLLLGGMSLTLLSSIQEWDDVTADGPEEGVSASLGSRGERDSSSSSSGLPSFQPKSHHGNLSLQPDYEKKKKEKLALSNHLPRWELPPPTKEGCNCEENAGGCDDDLYELAFHITPDGRLTRPPVCIVDMSCVNNRGNGLVATRDIRRGEVIFTERAAEATQIPRQCYSCSSLLVRKKERHVTELAAMEVVAIAYSTGKMARSMYGVRGCQRCFRSLEPASSCSSSFYSSLPQHGESDVNKGEVDAAAEPLTPRKGRELPMSHLWPISEYEYDNEAKYSPDKMRPGHILDNTTGRAFCVHCASHFCSVQCRDEHDKSMGSCCNCGDTIHAMIHATACAAASSQNLDLPKDTDADGENASSSSAKCDVQPALVLVARMFCASVQRYRRTRKEDDSGVSTACDDRDGPYRGMCGEAEDITPLELGNIRHEENFTVDEKEKDVVHEAKNSQTDCILHYSLESAHSAICNVLSLDKEERHLFDLKFLSRLAAVAARNGFDVMTQSPFRAYYDAILRATGGRTTERHAEVMKEIALVLGSEDGSLRREMDREVANRCAVQTVALFPLAARINHSCEPCAEVRGQEFVDCCIDLVATRGIEKGEELTISYINMGQSAGPRAVTERNRRIRELKAKYLFVCDCKGCRGAENCMK